MVPADRAARSGGARAPQRPERVSTPLDALDPVAVPDALRPVAERLFGDRLGLAERFAGLLAGAGVERGLIGPREVDRLWERHIVNCALLLDAIPADARTLADIGSGAGLPGLVVAIARPELEVTLVETMQRRCVWLEEAAGELGVDVEVVRARAEALHGEREFDVVTARAVAALDKLAGWTLPLVADGGSLVAMKGSSAADEVAEAASTLRRLGGVDPRLSTVGEGEVEAPTTVVTVRKEGAGSPPGATADGPRASRQARGGRQSRTAQKDRTTQKDRTNQQGGARRG
ncbi:hypothetical protein GCM10027268_16180 [Brachybacterium huguangmaarense]